MNLSRISMYQWMTSSMSSLDNQFQIQRIYLRFFLLMALQFMLLETTHKRGKNGNIFNAFNTIVPFPSLSKLHHKWISKGESKLFPC